MKDNVFLGQPMSPYHLSVGVVLFNREEQVASLYFREFRPPKQEKSEDVYILMRETLESGLDESLQDAAHRGIAEEFGATGVIRSYLGSLKSTYVKEGTPVEKTTLYFLMELSTYDVAKRAKGEEENDSVIEWRNVDFLIEKMEEQGRRLVGRSFDESEILKRAKKFFL